MTGRRRESLSEQRRVETEYVVDVPEFAVTEDECGYGTDRVIVASMCLMIALMHECTVSASRSSGVNLFSKEQLRLSSASQ